MNEATGCTNYCSFFCAEHCSPSDPSLFVGSYVAVGVSFFFKPVSVMCRREKVLPLILRVVIFPQGQKAETARWQEKYLKAQKQAQQRGPRSFTDGR